MVAHSIGNQEEISWLIDNTINMYFCVNVKKVSTFEVDSRVYILVAYSDLKICKWYEVPYESVSIENTSDRKELCSICCAMRSPTYVCAQLAAKVNGNAYIFNYSVNSIRTVHSIHSISETRNGYYCTAG